ncbi:MAG: hypothetical protein N3E49_05370 [Bacteroidia bacterium]|nr:hypothetical protein [Bacteroidia bacterium]
MQNSESSPKLRIPPTRPKTEVGTWLQAFLESAETDIPESLRSAFLRFAFRWFLQVEGGERLTEEEVRLRKDRFFSLLPEGLRVYFPWEEPSPLQPPPPPGLAYPQERTPFRQYGILARRWSEALSELSEAEQRALGGRLLRHLYQQMRHQGLPVEEATLIHNLSYLAEGKLHLSPQGLGDNPVSEPSERPHKRGFKPFRRRK